MLINVCLIYNFCTIINDSLKNIINYIKKVVTLYNKVPEKIVFIYY